jgi:hypothetical protein
MLVPAVFLHLSIREDVVGTMAGASRHSDQHSRLLRTTPNGSQTSSIRALELRSTETRCGLILANGNQSSTAWASDHNPITR